MANYRPLTDVRYLVVHCSATPPGMDIGRKEIDLWHRQQGWLMIGYHVVIRRDGSVEFGRAVDQPGAHVAGFNDKSLGVCLVGGVDTSNKTENNFTPEQFKTLADVLKAWRKDWPNAAICGHRDLAVDPKSHRRLKDCPSFDVEAWLPTVDLYN